MLCLKNELMKWGDFVHADISSWKFKVTLKKFWWAWQEMGMAFSGHETRTSALSQERIDDSTDFLTCW